MKEKVRSIISKIGKSKARENGEALFKKTEKGFVNVFARLKKFPKKGKIILCIALAIIIAIAGTGIYKWKKTKKAALETTGGTSIVRAGSLTNSISGSGTVEPIDQREIVPVVRGKIIEAPFAEGDTVKTGDVLYRFEMTAATNAIESANNSVEKARTNLSNRQSSLEKIYENIEKLNIKATSSGKISGLSLRLGEDVSGKVCTVTNFKEQTVTLPFSSAKIGQIEVGDSASVAVDKYMINTTGKVVRKHSAPDTLSSGAVVYYVEILLDDTYILEENINVTATVNGIGSASYGSVKYADPVTINASQKGEVKKINFKNGDWVNKGDIIAVLENDDLNDDLRNAKQSVKEAQMNLTEANNNLEDKEEEANEYVVTSPIDGVILTKDYEVGDTISGQNSTVMMVVADMSKMKFTISADELDISKIKMGQSVSVTADALTGQRLMGKITAISKLGSASNGVTNYPIEVTIDRPGDLMPGMNVSANIIVEQTFDTLYLPVEAVEYYGGKYYVTIVGEVTNMPERVKMPDMSKFQQSKEPSGEKEESSKEKSEEEKKDAPSQMPDRSQWGDKAQMPDRSQWGERPQGFEMPVREEAEKEETKTEEKPQTEEKEEGKTPSEKKPQTKETGESKEKNSQQGQNRFPSQQKQEELKIKYYKNEKRVEVEVGITTDTYYEIKSGVEYGQVVKNTSQVSSSSQGGFGMRGGMTGGMPAMGGNRNMPAMGGNRNTGSRNFGGR